MDDAERVAADLQNAMVALGTLGDEASVRIIELALITLASPSVAAQPVAGVYSEAAAPPLLAHSAKAVSFPAASLR